MIAFVFPGQGSQKKGMGKYIFDKYPEYVSLADRVLGYSVEELCLQNPEDKLNSTEYTQVAIYVVNCLEYLEYVKKTGIEPDYVAGHSLGEYNAMFAAKVFDFETGLRLVKKRGQLMGRVVGGSMAAVIGLSKEKLQKILDEHADLPLYVANYNTDEQIILSGKKEEIQKGKELFQSIGVRYSVLNVSGAFHTPYMTEPGKEFEEVARRCNFVKGVIPVISNVTAKVYDWDDISSQLIKQIDSPVRWSESVKYLLDNGVRHFVEIGNTKILTKMIDDIKQNYVAKSSEENTIAKNIEKKVITAKELGADSFKKRYGMPYAYLAGGMYRAISSKEMVAALSQSNILGFYGTGGVELEQIIDDIDYIKQQANKEQLYGVNIVAGMNNSDQEEKLISLLLEKEVRIIEASGYILITRGLIRYLAKGLYEENGQVKRKNRILAKISRPEAAEIFLNPAPDNIVQSLLDNNEINYQQSEWLRHIPVADDICVEADSGGHTDRGIMIVLLPAILRMRNRVMKSQGYKEYIHVGAAGGIGTPEAAATTLLLGAQFLMTGSINQCSVEAGTSMQVKNMLCQINIQDTDYAPAGDMLEYGSKVQVLKTGTFFVGRANKMYDIYKHYNSFKEINSNTINQLENTFFKRKISDILSEEKDYYKQNNLKDYKRLLEDEKYQLLVVIKWYFRNSTEFALKGVSERKTDYQIQCGKALGAFNDWVRGTKFERLENRRAAEIGEFLMNETAHYLEELYQNF